MSARGHEWADAWLRRWADWHHGEQYGRGYPAASAGFTKAGGVASEDTFDHMCEASDDYMCALVDAAVSDLEPIQGAAICHHYGIAAVWRFNRFSVLEVLPGALDDFERAARKRGVV